MRYFYEKPTKYDVTFGEIYICEHPLYSSCTLFKKDELGLAVVQKRFDPIKKIFYYGPINPDLNNTIATSPLFDLYFNEHARNCKAGLYPTVNIRKIMWALRIKPLKREFWENDI